MTNFYNHNDYITGDSFEILPTFEDQSVDHIITDPPYDLCELDKHWLHNEFMRVSKGAVIVFSPPENQWITPADEYGFWVKPISTKNTSKRMSRFVEMIFFYRRPVWNLGFHWSWYTNVFQELVDTTEFGKFRKPPSLIERLMRIRTNYEDLILDPFAGSGVVGEVATQLFRKSICIDLNENERHNDGS